MDLLLVKGDPLVTGALGLSYDVSVSIRSATSSDDITDSALKTCPQTVVGCFIKKKP